MAWVPWCPCRFWSRSAGHTAVAQTGSWRWFNSHKTLDVRQADRQRNGKIGRQADRDRQTGRQAGRQTGRQADRETGRQAGRQAGRQRDRKTGRQRDGKTGRHRDRKANRKTGRQADRQAGRETGRQAGRQEDRQAQRQEDRQAGRTGEKRREKQQLRPGKVFIRNSNHPFPWSYAEL